MTANCMKPPRQSVVKAALASGRFPGGVGLLAGLLMIADVSASECHLSLSRPQIDYGPLRVDTQPGPHGVSIGRRTVRLSVVCPEAAVIALRFRGAPADAQGFSFGHHGRFDLSLRQALLDGQAVELVSMHNRTERDGQLRPGGVLVPLRAGQPIAGRVFSAQVQVDTYLAGTHPAVRDKTLLEGGGRFEMVPDGWAIRRALR